MPYGIAKLNNKSVFNRHEIKKMILAKD